MGKLPRGHRPGLLILCDRISWHSSKNPVESFGKPSCPICGNWKFTRQPASWLTGTLRKETLRDILDMSDIMKIYGFIYAYFKAFWGQYHHEPLPPIWLCLLLLLSGYARCCWSSPAWAEAGSWSSQDPANSFGCRGYGPHSGCFPRCGGIHRKNHYRIEQINDCGVPRSKGPFMYNLM